MKLAVSLITVMLWALLAVACSATPAADPRKLVPSDVTFVGEVRVADILQERDLVKLYDSSPKGAGAPQTIQEFLASVTLQTGLDLETVQTAVLFGNAATDDGYAGAILRGQFGDPGLVSAFVKASPGLTDTKYKDRQVYVGEDGDASLAFTLLSKELLAAGSLSAVQSVIDVHRGDRAPVSGKVWDTFQSLGTPLFRLAAQVPSGGLSHLPSPSAPGQLARTGQHTAGRGSPGLPGNCGRGRGQDRAEPEAARPTELPRPRLRRPGGGVAQWGPQPAPRLHL